MPKNSIEVFHEEFLSPGMLILMRIGVLSYDYIPAIGGLGATVDRLVCEMRTAHCDVRVISPSNSSDVRVPWFSRFRFRKSGGCPLFSVGLIFALLHIIHSENLNLLHIHTGSGGAFILRTPSVPLLATAHHTYRQEVKMFRSLGQPLRAWKKYCMSFLEARTYHLATGITCVSEDTKQSLIEDYGIAAEKITVIENPIDVQRIPVTIEQGNERTLLFVGRLEERKGIFVLLRALKLLEKIPNPPRLLCLGADMLSGRVRRWVEENTMNDIIDLKGHVPDSEYHALLQQCPIVVVPSYLEGFGLVAAEAMMRGACVIASNCPGLRSIIRDRVTGVLFRTGDAQDCAEKIQTLMEDSVAREAIGDRAREEASKRFDPQMIARQYILKYQKLSS